MPRRTRRRVRRASGASHRLLLSLFLLSGAACSQPTSRVDNRPFTFVVLPDTQYYSKQYPHLFMAQTEWIKTRRVRENIRFVTQIGDIVHDRGKALDQWETASRAMSVLDGVVPYGISIGNHDYDNLKNRSVATVFLRYFGPQRYKSYAWFGGASENGLNSYQTFSAAGIQFVVLHLETDPPDAAITWAQAVLEKHPDHATILCTHAYLLGQNGVGRHPKPVFNAAGLSAEELWNRLIRRNPQVFMVLCGHEGKTIEYRQTSVNDAGHKVHELLADYQRGERGGNAFLRLIRFVPDVPRMEVRTYSPALDEFKTGDNSAFTLEWNVPSRLAESMRPIASAVR